MIYESENILSLFDGVSGGQIAWTELGYSIGKYYAAEVDKFAIKQTQRNFPDTIQLGDVRNVDVSKLPKISLLIGGSPCTDLSFAGKQSGLIMDTFDQYMELRDEYLKTGNEDLYFHNGKLQQSILFWEYLRILKDLKKINPDIKFLLENVKMTKKNQLKFNMNIGLMPVNINSNRVSAQNRDRYYWTNIRTRKDGFFDELHTDIPQPKDRGIFLKDILQPESEVDEKYYIKSPKVGFDGMNINGKGNSLRIGGQCSQTKKHNYDIIPVVNDNGKLRQTEDKSIPAIQRLEPVPGDKTNCLTSVAKDNLIFINGKNSSGNRFFSEIGKHQSLVENGRSNSGVILKVNEATKKGYTEINPGECVDLQNINSKTRKGRKMVDKSNCLMSGKTEFHKFTEDLILRRLTPTECARLQTIPDWYIWDVSDTQIYKLLGNGFTIEVIKHILSYYKPTEK